jgi:hypothetical protein
MRRGLLLSLAALLGCLCVAAPGGATARRGGTHFRIVIVGDISPSELRGFASRGAVGLLVPGTGPRTSGRLALAALRRGATVNTNLGGAPQGRILVSVSSQAALRGPEPVIIVSLPPAAGLRWNDRRYPIVVIGGGFHGLLHSATTRIPGLVSIVDIAPTALGHARGSLTSSVSADAVSQITRLDRQIHANNRLKLPALIILACLLILLAAFRPRTVLPSLLAALLTSSAIGALQITREPLIVALFVVGSAIGGMVLAGLCNTDGRLLGTILGVLALHVVLLVMRPEWIAVSPLGPTQNSRFWGIGNQLETLLLAPILAGAMIAGRRYGIVGFASMALIALTLVTDNRLGSDGGGAIVFGLAFAFVGARVMRRGPRGFMMILLLSATAVLTIVSVNLKLPGPDHLRSAFSGGAPGLLSVVENRVPLAYLPALHEWKLILPLALWFGATLAVALTVSDRSARDLVIAAALAIGVSLLVNDSAAYELTGGVAVLAGLARLRPAPEALAVPSHLRVPLGSRPAPSETRRG